MLCKFGWRYEMFIKNIYSKLNNWNFIPAVKIMFSCSPFKCIMIILQKIINAIIPSLQIIINANIINSIIESVKNKQLDHKALVYLTLLVLTLVVSMLFEKLIYFVNIRFLLQIRKEIEPQLLMKYGELSYKNMEDSEILDLINRTLDQPVNKLLQTYCSIIDFIAFICTVVSIAFVLVQQIWWVGILLILVSIPLFRIAIMSGKANYQANREMTKLNRESDYLYEILTGRDSAEERTFFRYSKMLEDKWHTCYEESRKFLFKTEFSWFAKMKLGSVITSLISLIVIVILTPFVVSKLISVGIYISLINGILQLVDRMSWELTYLTDEVANNLEYIKDYYAFWSLAETKGVTLPPKETDFAFQSIEFRNVSFKYPKTDVYILKGMSFMIENGKHYALVGLNGAGKSTVIKLLTGLYDEFEGEILINGKSINLYEECELKTFFAVAFQDFARFNITLKDNLEIGNINKMGKAEDDILKAIDFMNLQPLVERLPDGIDSFLGKINKNGVDLSGGEWQRIALARNLMSPAPVRIMDEPTAALDPISESRLYEKFEKICANQTTIFISHRLGSTKLADEIIVIDDGKVAEKGSHEELLNANCLYSKMYELQRSWYN
jgi:ATP-binding cassette, subfamily B, bacterial